MTVAFSGDGRLLASGGLDARVVIWDTETGRQLRTLLGHSQQISALAFSADGEWLASGSTDETVRIWAGATGVQTATLKGAGWPERLLFSPNRHRLVARLRGGRVVLWDPASGRTIASLDDEKPTSFETLAFSPDGRWLLFPSGTVVDTESGSIVEEESTSSYAIVADSITFSGSRENRTLTVNGRRLRVAGVIETWALSPDRRWLAIGGADGSIGLWQPESAAEIQRLSLGQAPVNSVTFSPDSGTLVVSGETLLRTWQTGTWREDRRWELRPSGDGVTGKTRFIKPTPDRRWLARGLSYGMNERSVEFWDAETSQNVAPVLARKAESDLELRAVSPDGRWETSRAGNQGSSANKVMLVNTRTNERRLLGGQVVPIADVSMSRDGRWIAETSPRGDRALRVWDAATGIVTERFAAPGRGSDFSSVAFAANGEWVVAGVIGQGVHIWNALGGNVLQVLKGSGAAFDLSTDGQRLAQRAGRWFQVWDLSTGTIVSSQPAVGSPAIDEIAMSPDGASVAAMLDQPTFSRVAAVSIRDAIDGRELRRLEVTDAQDAIGSKRLLFSRDGQRLAATYRSKAVVWDLTSGAVSFSVDGWINTMQFSPDGRRLATVATNGSDVALWDLASRQNVLTLKGHTTYVTAVSFSEDGNWLLTGSDDGTARLWESTTGRQAALLALMEGTTDWLVITPDGLFDGSIAGMQKLVAWRAGGEVVPLEAFFNEFYYPGLLGEILAGRRPTARRDIARIDRRQPDVTVALSAGQSDPDAIATRRVALKLTVTEAKADSEHAGGSGARDVRLFRNGSLVRVWRGDVLGGNASAATLETTVSLVAGENRFAAYAFNGDNVKSGDATLVLNGAAALRRPGTAYILALGINKYANANYNLTYAVPDAQAFATELSERQSALGSYARIETVTLTDQDATKGNILLALKRLAGNEAPLPAAAPAALQKITPAQPEDAVFVYYAGHGTASGPRFHLIPHDLGYAGARDSLDARGLQAILGHSISDLDLEEALEKVDAGRLVLVIDACNSGQALEAEEKRRGPLNSKGLAQLAYEKGMYILAAAQGYQAALEAAQLGHGYLTFALVEEGLKTPAADIAPRDGQVVLREWLDYATQRVPVMQSKMMQESRKAGRDLVFVQGEQAIKDLAKRSLQRPRVYYRRDPESQPLVVAKPEAAPPR